MAGHRHRDRRLSGALKAARQRQPLPTISFALYWFSMDTPACVRDLVPVPRAGSESVSPGPCRVPVEEPPKAWDVLAQAALRCDRAGTPEDERGCPRMARQGRVVTFAAISRDSATCLTATQLTPARAGLTAEHNPHRGRPAPPAERCPSRSPRKLRAARPAGSPVPAGITSASAAAAPARARIEGQGRARAAGGRPRSAARLAPRRRRPGMSCLPCSRGRGPRQRAGQETALILAG